jgi:nucleotide-binding universal stress UspA family protein
MPSAEIAMSTQVTNDRRPALGIRATRNAPVVIATDGLAQSEGAVALGYVLAGAPDAAWVVSVLRPMPRIPTAGAALTTDIDRTRRADLLRDAQAQLRRVTGEAIGVEVDDGDPAATIARVAHTASASLIVCGLGRHNIVDRILGDETALRVVRLADVPVLAVPASADRAPSSIVVACDFSETSLRAARAAVAFAAPAATIYLVHVAPRDHTRYEWDGWGKAYREDSLDALNKMKHQLHPESKTIVQSIMLQGDVADELLRFATNVHADLIATGSHGHGFVTRLLIGSVATRILRAATCSVLTVPHAAALTDLRTMALPPVGRTVPRDDWAQALAEFTRRNLGRAALLEVDDAEIGAQAQEFDYPLRGAAFDHNDQRITLMFGGGDFGNGHHLTRGIAKPTSLDILTEQAGRDIALRIGHGKGQTLLTFVG